MVEKNRIYVGEAKEILAQINDETVDSIITSPPYWKLRKYNNIKELGEEEFFNDYISNLCDIFDECKRVLKQTGSLWVNIGDTYLVNSNYWEKCEITGKKKGKINSEIMKKNLTQGVSGGISMIPERFAMEMSSVNRGWCLKNKIIWDKIHSPCSALNMFATDYEMIYLFLKNSKKYYFKMLFEDHGRSKIRSIWRVLPAIDNNTAHTAPYPEELVARMIEAGCPKKVCSKCGMPAKIEHKYIEESGFFNKIGFKNCSCDAGWERAVVLDPFVGSGTTAVVASKMGRDFIGIEINENFAEIAIKKTNNELLQTNIFDIE